jgi:uncharacterized protein (TIRG00374 family)
MNDPGVPSGLRAACGDPPDRAAGGSDAGRGRLWPWSVLRYGAAIAVLAVILVYFVVPELRQAHLSELAHIGVPWLIAGVLLEGISLFCYSLLTRSLLPPQGPKLLTVFRIDMSCTALGHVVPAGSAASAAFGYRLFTSRGVQAGDVYFMMASQGPGSSVVLNLLLWMALLISIPLTGFHRIYLGAGLAALAALVTAATLVYLFTKGEEWVVRLTRCVLARIPRVREDAAEPVVRAIAAAVRGFRSDPRRMRRALAWATVNWLVGAGSLWCFLAALGHYADPVVLFAAFGIANVAAAIPLTPSGLGVVEVTLPLLLAADGVTKGVATLAVIGWRFANFWLPIPVGAAAYLSLRLPRRPVRTRHPPRGAPPAPGEAEGTGPSHELDRPVPAGLLSEDDQMEDLRRAAIDVLTSNERDGYTAPARGLYTHQHLWDTCFIAIGQRHYDVTGAMGSLRRLLRAQWRNGMIPNIVFEPGWRYWWDRRVWRSRISASAPRGVATAGITQPPMTAEAVLRVGQVLPAAEQATWYGSVCRPLVAYHEWLYRERSGHGSGLVVLVHPWETGLDNTPPWLESLRDQPLPWWLHLMVATRADRLASHLRLDTKYVPADQRASTVEALRLYDALRRIRRDSYDSAAILKHPPFAIEDLTYNCILIRANTLLRQLTAGIGVSLPATLESAMRKNEEALESLWDNTAESYYSRDVRTGELLKEQSIAALMPLYAGCIDARRAKRLASMLADPALFGARYPVPSAPLGSHWFNPTRYWQGPTWVNMNWLIIDGLRRYGLAAEAQALRQKTLELVTRSGFYEYYDPLNGKPAGVKDFSWTAALSIDLLETPSRAGPPGSAGPG